MSVFYIVNIFYSVACLFIPLMVSFDESDSIQSIQYLFSLWLLLFVFCLKHFFSFKAMKNVHILSSKNFAFHVKTRIHLEMILMWGKSQVLIALFSEWIFHWLGSIYGKELAFPLCSTLPILLSVKDSYMCRSTSVLSIMFLWFLVQILHSLYYQSL